jgi:L-asparagine transporter-like permease
LSQGQLNMIAIGGVIGAGLFVGSDFVVSKTGPGAFLTFALCGVLMALVMRMLGEMVISTLPIEDSAWLRYDLVSRAASTYPIPVQHVVACTSAVEVAN